MSVESVADQIAAFLKPRRNLPYCDDCLFLEVAAASIDEVRSATKLLRSEINFLAAEPAPCVGCGKIKPVLLALIG